MTTTKELLARLNAPRDILKVPHEKLSAMVNAEFVQWAKMLETQGWKAQVKFLCHYINPDKVEKELESFLQS